MTATQDYNMRAAAQHKDFLSGLEIARIQQEAEWRAKQLEMHHEIQAAKAVDRRERQISYERRLAASERQSNLLSLALLCLGLSCLLRIAN